MNNTPEAFSSNAIKSWFTYDERSVEYILSLPEFRIPAFLLWTRSPFWSSTYLTIPPILQAITVTCSHFTPWPLILVRGSYQSWKTLLLNLTEQEWPSLRNKMDLNRSIPRCPHIHNKPTTRVVFVTNNYFFWLCGALGTQDCQEYLNLNSWPIRVKPLVLAKTKPDELASPLALIRKNHLPWAGCSE